MAAYIVDAGLFEVQTMLIQGEKAIIRDATGQLIAVEKVVRVMSTQAIISQYGRFVLKSGKAIGRDLYASSPGQASIAAAEAELERRKKDMEEAKAQSRQAVYDALPDSIKMARRIRYAFDIASEQTVAEMPDDLLLRLSQWADAIVETADSK